MFLRELEERHSAQKRSSKDVLPNPTTLAPKARVPEANATSLERCKGRDAGSKPRLDTLSRNTSALRALLFIRNELPAPRFVRPKHCAGALHEHVRASSALHLNWDCRLEHKQVRIVL